MEEEKDKGVEVKDKQIVKQQAFFRNTKEVTFRDVPDELFIKIRDFARANCKGNFTLALSMMMQATEFQEQMALLASRVNELDARVTELEGKPEEEPKRKKPKTFKEEKEVKGK